MNKFHRQGAILRLVRERALSTQAEVVEALREQGIEAVQPTVSRDIHRLGLVKVRSVDGRLVYSIPGPADIDRQNELTSALRRWALSIEASGNLVVVKTPAGYATPLADAIDAAALADVAGTVAGENTIFVAARDGAPGTELAELLRHHVEGDAA
jgi:transcriptional regulator of arginine metabolism